MSIKKYLTICLLLINASCAFISKAQNAINSDITVSTNESLFSAVPYTNSSAVKLKTLITTQKAQISGITIVKLKGDSVSGAFVNEFGMVGFEFIVCKGKCKLFKLIKNLDKWYIRRTLSDDMAFIFAISKRKSSDSIQLVDHKKRYVFDSNGNITRAEFINKGKIIKTLLIEKEGSITMINHKQKLTYNLSIIKE